MLVRGCKHAAFVPVVLLFVLFVALRFRHDLPTRGPVNANNEQQSLPPDDGHREVFSVSTEDKAYFLIDFGAQKALNPSIIPHPTVDDVWIIVAQLARGPEESSDPFRELTCFATFTEGALRCASRPINVPIAATSGDPANCVGELEFFSLNVGPHDARVFYGPEIPYIVYGSNSDYTCFGQWIQDFTTLTVDGVFGTDEAARGHFKQATELQRPVPYQPVEKNWFVFWDSHQQMYAHYDIAPERAFAKLENDGSVGPDLAPLASVSDKKCMDRYMPKVAPQSESIHQATNALSITLCKRQDPACEPNDFNTFILTVFQHKSFYNFHAVYEPYAMLFRQAAPFELHAISSKPVWIHGRGKPGERPSSDFESDAPDSWGHSEMFYVTSISWKSRGQKYHGYADDVLFIGFGIEDSHTGGIDIVAGDLLTDLGTCFNL